MQRFTVGLQYRSAPAKHVLMTIRLLGYRKPNKLFMIRRLRMTRCSPTRRSRGEGEDLLCGISTGNAQRRIEFVIGGGFVVHSPADKPTDTFQVITPASDIFRLSDGYVAT
jgi:hypothetical protein